MATRLSFKGFPARTAPASWRVDEGIESEPPAQAGLISRNPARPPGRALDPSFMFYGLRQCPTLF
jgi:hypothetical protein